MTAPEPKSNDGGLMQEIDEIVDVFEFLGNWDQRYQYLIEMGEKLKPMPKEHMNEDNRVKACMSKVWVRAYRDEENPQLLRYYGDCDTAVIKGVVALLVKLCSGKTPDQIIELDLDALFNRLNLDQHLSPNRHVGVFAIVEQMKQQAREMGNG